MLMLLQAPHWAPPGDPPRPLPATVPGALLAYLAAQAGGQGAWVERERVVALFWPDRPAAEGQRNLRVNLHRLRELLAGWGCEAALHAERTRLQLVLPSDLVGLAAAVRDGGAAALLAAAPAGWLQGFRLPGFEELRRWFDDEGERWQARWHAAVEPALVQALVANGAPGDAAAEAALTPLLTAWLAAGGRDLPTLRGLDATGLTPGRRAVWQQLCARLPEAAPAVARDRGGWVAAVQGALPGRRAEQDALRASSAAAAVVLGEPGVGKTSLLASCWPGAPMLHGREGLAGAPFAPVLEWLRLHGEQWRPGLLDAGAAQALPLAPYRLDLARLLPELAPDEPLPPLDAHTAKARLLEALSRLFERLGPVLLIDDLQWCDAATLEWLVFAAHRGRQRWRASARRHELAGAARQALDSLRAARLVDEQPLAALARDALGEACRQRWPHRFDGSPASEAVLDGLQAACDGNPFVLGELVAMGADERLARGEAVSLPPRARDLVLRRLDALAPEARTLLEAAAVLVRPSPLPLLRAVCDGLDDGAALRACEQALAADMLLEVDGGLQCRHDLIRSAATGALSAARRQWLHRRAALALGALPEPEPLAVAAHWQAAQEPQTALAWLHRGAAQQKTRGHFDEARALWQQVADESLDATQALRARLALAECELFSNLTQGRAALEEVMQQLGAVADLQQRHPIEAQTLAGLIDNAVFSGDIPRAVQLAPRLRELLPSLRTDERVHAMEVLIELAMREPDIPGARALLQQVQRLAPRSPSTLSFEAQVHWFAGDARAACQAFEALLAAHPDYCSGLTIENDLAVMLNALGELHRAEAMVRRSLANWRGVAHTEALSLLVLGSVLTGLGRHGAARDALAQALQLAQEQGSGLFEAEALVRRARLWLQCGRLADARADLDRVEPLLRASADPMRVSQYALVRAACQMAQGEPIDPGLAERLRGIGLKSVHPLLHARLARLEVLMALQADDPARALQAAGRQAEIARAAGLLEPLGDALLLQSRALALVGRLAEAPAPLREAAALAQAQGLADIAWRALAGLAALEPGRAAATAERQARQHLLGDERPALFQPTAAAGIEPRLPPSPLAAH